MRVNFFIVVPIFAIAAMATEYYSDMYDKTNVDSIMKSDRLLKAYLDCLLDQGPCTADARAFKTTLPDAIATECERCSPKQKEIARTIIRHFKQHKPEAYRQLTQKYDPNDRFMDQFIKILGI